MPKSSVPSAGTNRREINAKFKQRLPHIFEGLSQTILKVEPHLLEAQTHVSEFRDFLEFEIMKMELQIRRDEWESRIDVTKATADMQWLADLKALLRGANPDDVIESTEMLNELLSVAKELLTPGYHVDQLNDKAELVD
jgi:hypothetical protein